MSKNSFKRNNDLTGQNSKSRPWLTAIIVVLSTIVLFFLAEILGDLIISLYPLLNHWSDHRANLWLSNSIVAQFSYGVLADGLIVAGVMLLMRWLHWSWATIGLTRPKLRHIIYGLLAVVPYYLLYIAAVFIVSSLVPGLNLNQSQDIGFSSVHGLIPLLLTFISLVVIPPLAEEIAVRGFLYTGLRKWLPKIASALIVSILFGAAHLPEGGNAGPLWIGAIDTFTLSLVLVFLREKTGNLWASITLHALKNGIAFVSLFIIIGR